MGIAAGSIGAAGVRRQAADHFQSLRHGFRLHVQQARGLLILVRRQLPPAALDQAEGERTLQAALFKLNQQGIPQIRRSHAGRVHPPQHVQGFLHIPHAEALPFFQLLRGLRQEAAVVQGVNQQEQGVPGAPGQRGMLRLVRQMGFQGFRSHHGLIHEIAACGGLRGWAAFRRKLVPAVLPLIPGVSVRTVLQGFRRSVRQFLKHGIGLQRVAEKLLQFQSGGLENLHPGLHGLGGGHLARHSMLQGYLTHTVTSYTTPRNLARGNAPAQELPAHSRSGKKQQLLCNVLKKTCVYYESK